MLTQSSLIDGKELDRQFACLDLLRNTFNVVFWSSAEFKIEWEDSSSSLEDSILRAGGMMSYEFSPSSFAPAKHYLYGGACVDEEGKVTFPMQTLELNEQQQLCLVSDEEDSAPLYGLSHASVVSMEDCCVAFGGLTQLMTRTDKTYMLSRTNEGKTGKWKEINMEGLKPSGRAGHAFCRLDEQHFVICGGKTDGNDLLNDFWICKVRE